MSQVNAINIVVVVWLLEVYLVALDLQFLALGCQQHRGLHHLKHLAQEALFSLRLSSIAIRLNLTTAILVARIREVFSQLRVHHSELVVANQISVLLIRQRQVGCFEWSPVSLPEVFVAHFPEQLWRVVDDDWVLVKLITFF